MPRSVACTNAPTSWAPRRARASHSAALAVAVLVAGGLAALGAGAARAQTFPSTDDTPPAGWTGPVFALSQDYPAAAPAPQPLPWKAIDFRTSPVTYARSVLRYAMQGNVAVDWRGQDNAVRTWYHAPWMHRGSRGRELVHGLTRERDSGPGDLHPDQTGTYQNWAVSLYNALGGFTIGQVWADPEAPDATKALFPEGTVAIKLLFTMAPPDDVPTLLGAPEWEAFVGAPQQIRTVRLLQVDLAVRDDRADATTGWVFGTFVYDPAAAGTAGMRPWDKLTPVGIMWGNDPALLGTGQPLQESKINPRGRALVTHLGWEGRLNGPVDNPVSSCLSCHGAAQDPIGGTLPRTTSQTSLQRFFRNIPAGVAFNADRDDDHVSTDYSLQLAMGMRSQRQALGVEPEPELDREVPSMRSGITDTLVYADDATAPPTQVASTDGTRAAAPSTTPGAPTGPAETASADGGDPPATDAVGGDAPSPGAPTAASDGGGEGSASPISAAVAAAWLVGILVLGGVGLWLRATRRSETPR